MIQHLRLVTAMCLVTLLVKLNVSADNPIWTYSCHTGVDIISDNSTDKCSTDGATEEDAKAAAYCFGPNNTLVNNTFTGYGCGKCPKKAKKGTCMSCPAWVEGSDNSNCNVWQPIFTYSCFESEVPVVCNNGTGVLLKDIHCWGPKPTYKGNNVDLTKSGCGTCEAAHVANSTWDIGDCSTCNYNNCNSAATFVSFLSVFAAVFWLCNRN
ncbi:hypothetical protein ACHWQZ_G001711 [Mnemiopsis leidyi]